MEKKVNLEFFLQDVNSGSPRSGFVPPDRDSDEGGTVDLNDDGTPIISDRQIPNLLQKRNLQAITPFGDSDRGLDGDPDLEEDVNNT